MFLELVFLPVRPSGDGRCRLEDLHRARSLYKGPKKAIFPPFFTIFSAFFPNIWPLAGPNIAKKGWPLQALARVDRQTHFGTFDFWSKPGFWWFWRVLRMFCMFCAWGAPDNGARWDDGVGRTTERIRTTARGAPQAVGEAALAADLITA